MKSKLFLLTAALGATLLALPSCAAAEKAAPTKTDGAMPYRWLYLQTNLQITDNLKKMQDLMKRAKAANYNGVVLADSKLSILDQAPGHYLKNARAFR